MKKVEWRFQKQTDEQILNYLTYNDRFRNIPLENRMAVVKLYQKFCKRFKDNKIPYNFGIDCITDIRIIVSRKFSIYFNGVRYDFGLDLVMSKGKTVVHYEDWGLHTLSYKYIKQPQDRNSEDWLYQELTVDDILKFFEKEDLFRDNIFYQFDEAAKRRAAEFYAERCSFNMGYKIEKFLAIGNISHIEMDKSPYIMRFYYKDNYFPFSYLGYPTPTSGFGMW